MTVCYGERPGPMSVENGREGGESGQWSGGSRPGVGALGTWRLYFSVERRVSRLQRREERVCWRTSMAVAGSRDDVRVVWTVLAY